MTAPQRHSGSCLCGETRYSFMGDLHDVYFCHCSQCRRNYGLYGAFVGADRGTFAMSKSDRLRSFQSSPTTTRTFCGACGSGIAWDREGYERIYVLTGTLEGDPKIGRGKHIHTEDRGHYYKFPE
jgi:hypothetical protein